MSDEASPLLIIIKQQDKLLRHVEGLEADARTTRETVIRLEERMKSHERLEEEITARKREGEVLQEKYNKLNEKVNRIGFIVTLAAAAAAVVGRSLWDWFTHSL